MKKDESFLYFLWQSFKRNWPLFVIGLIPGAMFATIQIISAFTK